MSSHQPESLIRISCYIGARVTCWPIRGPHCVSLTNQRRGRNLGESPGLVTRPSGHYPWAHHLTNRFPGVGQQPGAGSQWEARTRVTWPRAANRRGVWGPGAGPGSPRMCWSLSVSARTCCDPQDGIQISRAGIWTDLSLWHFILLAQLRFPLSLISVSTQCSPCLASVAESGPRPESEQWCLWWEAAKSSSWGNILTSCRNSGRHSRD